MSAVFADTFFYLALLNEDDPAHRRALAESRNYRPIITSEFVLLELGNACSRAADHADFIALVAGIRTSPRTTVVKLNSTLFDRGLHLMRDRSDKDWSLTDCVLFVVMQDAGIREALTGDGHFTQAGFSALLA